MTTVQLVAKTIVINEAGQVLLLRRSPTDPTRPHDWDFPGGGLDDGEDFRQAAIRELNEEIGVVCDEMSLSLVYVGSEYYEPADRIYFRHLYAIKFSGRQTIKLSFEHDHFAWMDVDKALEVFQHRFYNPGLRFARDRGMLSLA